MRTFFYVSFFRSILVIDFELFWYDNMKENITLSLKEIIIGFCGKDLDFLNYCILVGKSLSYQCRRNEMKLTISLFKVVTQKV